MTGALLSQVRIQIYAARMAALLPYIQSILEAKDISMNGSKRQNKTKTNNFTGTFLKKIC